VNDLSGGSQLLGSSGIVSIFILLLQLLDAAPNFDRLSVWYRKVDLMLEDKIEGKDVTCLNLSGDYGYEHEGKRVAHKIDQDNCQQFKMDGAIAKAYSGPVADDTEITSTHTFDDRGFTETVDASFRVTSFSLNWLR